MSKLFPRNLVAPRRGALIAGAVYLAVYLFGLSELLSRLLAWMGLDLTTLFGNFLLNLIYFLLNFTAVLVIFHRFLWESRTPVQNCFGRMMLTVLIGLGVYLAATNTLSLLYAALDITPQNLNNDAVNLLLESYPLPMILCTVVLAPVTEECLFRGVLFGPLCRRCPWAAYVLSAGMFAGIHVVPAIGLLPALDVALCFLLYVPAGLALCWVYQKTRSIWASITLHTIVNLQSVLATLLFTFLEGFYA